MFTINTISSRKSGKNGVRQIALKAKVHAFPYMLFWHKVLSLIPNLIPSTARGL